MQQPRYEILVATGEGEFYGTRSGDWEPIAHDSGVESVEEGERLISDLLQIDLTWAVGTYGIAEFGASRPDYIYRPPAN